MILTLSLVDAYVIFHDNLFDVYASCDDILLPSEKNEYSKSVSSLGYSPCNTAT